MKEILNYRYYVLFAMAFVATLLVFGEESSELSTFSFLFIFLLDKTLGATMIYLTIKLFQYWDKKKQIPFLSHLIEESEYE